jgi:hypothetical protein
MQKKIIEKQEWEGGRTGFSFQPWVQKVVWTPPLILADREASLTAQLSTPTMYYSSGALAQVFIFIEV